MDGAAVSPQLFAIGLFLGMLLLLEVGNRMGRRTRPERPAGGSGFGAVEGAVFGLFGLLVAFTFSGAASRFDSRRMLIADEANAIGTAYLRLDLLAPEDRADLRRLFRDYLDSRLAVYRKLPDVTAALQELKRSAEMQGVIWERSVAAAQRPGTHPSTPQLLLPALNEMFDITTTRTVAANSHPPLVIFGLLFALGLGCALLAGYGMAPTGSRSWLHIVGFAAVTAVATYVILEIEYPRMGLIRLSAYDQVLVDLRESMRF